MRPGRTTGAFLTIAALFAVAAPAWAEPPSVDAAGVALHAGNASNAVALATQALADPSLTPRDRARVLIDRGLAHEMLGERDGALIDLTEAINAHALPAPEQARAFYDRGVTLDELTRTDDAAGDYSAAIRLEPKFAAALNNRANAYRRLNRLAEARADYLASIAAGNSHKEYPDFGLGQIAEASGQIEEARGYYRAALTVNPQFTLASERLNALGNAAPVAAAPSATAPVANAPVVLRPPGGGTVHLRPPGQPAAPVAPADDGVVHLRPPGEAVIHLHPPGDGVVHLHPPGARPPAAARLDLKPAISEGAGAATGRTVQLGAWRSQADAAIAWSRIAAVTGNLMAGLSPQVLPVDLPGRGRWYRLRTGPIDGAPGLCAALKAKGLACIVVPD